MQEKIKIIITDDKPQFRKVLCEILEVPTFTVINQAENGEILLKLLETTIPDIILLDLEMPVMDGNKAFELIRTKYPHLKVIILSMHCEGVLMENYIERGAKGYIPKDAIMGDPDLLINAISHIHTGGTFIYELPPPKDKFTKRQVDIMPLMFDGLTNTKIAEQVGISKRAVEKQRKIIYEKSGTSKAIDFYKFAFARGLQFLSRILPKK